MPDSARLNLITQPGIYDLDMDTYHSQCCEGPSISSGGLRKIENESPAHFWCQASGLNPDAIAQPRKAAFEFGKAVHALLFDDQEEISRLVVCPYENYKKQVARDWRDAQWADGNIIITEDDFTAIKAMHDTLAAEPNVPELLTAGEPEKSMIWKDQETGVWLKSRPDRIPTDAVLADLKTCDTANPRILNNDRKVRHTA